ncbi:type II secretion system protein [Wenzhouxiangella sp. AB-CW3]|nr:type II secretion system protein [Wenzhouxiangella sp. AB-CW3]
MNIRQSQGGFTLIELVIVIVLLGILAAVAVPRFIDLSDEAAQAAVDGVAGGLASASAINYAAVVAGSPEGDDSVESCDDIVDLMVGFDTDRFSVTGGSLGTNPGDSAECTVTDDDTDAQATFQGIRSADA